MLNRAFQLSAQVLVAWAAIGVAHAAVLPEPGAVAATYVPQQQNGFGGHYYFVAEDDPNNPGYQRVVVAQRSPAVSTAGVLQILPAQYGLIGLSASYNASTNKIEVVSVYQQTMPNIGTNNVVVSGAWTPGATPTLGENSTMFSVGSFGNAVDVGGYYGGGLNHAMVAFDGGQIWHLVYSDTQFGFTSEFVVNNPNWVMWDIAGYRGLDGLEHAAVGVGTNQLFDIAYRYNSTLQITSEGNAARSFVRSLGAFAPPGWGGTDFTDLIVSSTRSCGFVGCRPTYTIQDTQYGWSGSGGTAILHTQAIPSVTAVKGYYAADPAISLNEKDVVILNSDGSLTGFSGTLNGTATVWSSIKSFGSF